MGSLDLAGQHRLPAHEHEHEQVGIGEDPDGAVEPAKRLIGAGEQHLKRLVHVQRRIRRQRLGQEGPKPVRETPVASGAAADGRSDVHMCPRRQHRSHVELAKSGQVPVVMRQVSVHEAKTHLSRLLRQVVLGEDVVITRSGRPVARLVAVEDERPVFGVDEGRFVVPDDFDEPLDEELLRAFEGRSGLRRK